MSHEKVRLLLNQAEECLLSYQQELDSDNIVDIAEFEGIVYSFCDEIGKMSKEDAKIYENSLKVLGESLEVLSEVLAEKRDDLKSQIQGLNASSQAHSAYKKPGAK